MGATNRRLAGFFTTTNLIDFAHRRYRNLILQHFYGLKNLWLVELSVILKDLI